jgi:hypothetical protein
MARKTKTKTKVKTKVKEKPKTTTKSKPIPDAVIANRIILLDGQNVMIDRDLAELYGVTTFRLNEQVTRNLARFPPDFMRVVTPEEKEYLIKTYKHLESLKFSPTLPRVFTEHGAVMLASVLNSEHAIQVNIQIVRIFSKMKLLMVNYKKVLQKLGGLEEKTLTNSKEIQLIIEYLKKLTALQKQADRQRIGFRRQNEKD